MKNVSQNAIKKNNIQAIFDAISGSQKGIGISRAEISRETGLSLMTVGKIADLLIEKGTVVQVKPITGNAGRRAGMLDISCGHFIAVFDLSSRAFRAVTYDLRLEKTGTVEYEYVDELMPEDNAAKFFTSVLPLLAENLKKCSLVGIGICVTGRYDAERDVTDSQLLSGVRIKELIKKNTGLGADIVENDVRAAAFASLSENSKLSDGGTAFIYLDRNSTGCLSYNGDIIPKLPDFESIVCRGGQTLGAVMNSTADKNTLCAALCSAIESIESVAAPERVVLGVSHDNASIFGDGFAECVRLGMKKLGHDIEIITSDNAKELSVLGVATAVKQMKLGHLL